MAIQMRRGDYPYLNKQKLLPGEWAVVLKDDPSAKDGKSVYVCFSAGSVKRMATYEDMVDSIRTAVETDNAAIIKTITDAVNATNESVKSAESTRVANENQRVANEKARQQNESSRKSTFDQTVASCKEKTDEAAADARKAAEEARGSVSPDKQLYIAYDTVGDTEYISLVDTEE